MKPLTILVVEDEIITAIDIQSSLENLGYIVPSTASKGEEAIEKVETLQPDLVLMDIVLKGDIDGVEAAGIIRDRYQIPVIFLTAYSDDATLNRAGITEPFGYLLKPFDDRELHTTIQIAIKRHEAEKQIREQRDLAEELRQEAEKLVELKSRYISMTSHEFRTPMTAIQMSAELLEHYSHKWSDEKKQKHLLRIQSSIKNMTQLLDDILTIGKGEAGKLEFNPAPLDLLQFCKEIVEEQQVATVESRINFVASGDLEHAFLDEKLLRHILTNLLSNALKYSPSGGEVNFKIDEHDRKLVLEIQDSGIGIPEMDLQNLFQSFQRAKNVGNIAGTGLGLAIVKKCVDRHNGQIAVSSRVNEGTTFTVILPMDLTPESLS